MEDQQSSAERYNEVMNEFIRLEATVSTASPVYRHIEEAYAEDLEVSQYTSCLIVSMVTLT